MLTRLLKSFYFNAVIFKSEIHYRARHLLKIFTLNGVRLSIDHDEVLSKPVLLGLLQGGYEKKENKILKKYLEPADKVLELGSGLGYNSITAAKINGNQVLSYECNPVLIPLIKSNQQLNGVQFDVKNKLLQFQSKETVTKSFFVSKNALMSSFKKYENPKHEVVDVTNIETEYAVEVLSSFLPTFLMVDIEGGEEEFFSQPELIRSSSIKKILVEVHPDIIGEDGSSTVVKNILDAGFLLSTEASVESVFYFSRG